MEDRLKIVLTSEDYAAYLALRIRARKHGESGGQLPCIYEAHEPRECFFTQGVYSLSNGMCIGYYDNQFAAVDKDIYNLTFVADLEETALIGWLLNPLEMREQWEPLARQMIQTIEMGKVGE